ncbi:polysulfide reductase NrfD [Blastococcus jejuensis]|uniref:Polysulfide reductase NrfD n=1 Tax=Blastococcus jejuensis TaxID=351224 RepID=A0ABP6PJR9_9ACTN
MTEGLATPGAGWRRADGGYPKKKRKGNGDGRRRSGRRAAGEVAMVEDAEFTSYYGRPIIKAPVWKTPDVPLYLFLGGAAGSSAVLGALADLTGRTALTRTARLVAGGGSIASVVFLIHDLGRPERFLHMLRVFKPTSPLSVGTYILSPFSAATGATAAVELLGWFPRLKRFGGIVAGLFGGPMATYTAVLLSNTAVPSWHEFHGKLPFVFAGSAMAAGGGLCMALTPMAESEPARKMAIAGAALELAVVHQVEGDESIVAEPYHEGRAGKLMRAAKACTASGLGLAVLGGRTRWGRVASGTLLAAGSLLTRFGVFDAGMASARDPKYTVIPQRERIAARGSEVRSVSR